MSTHYEILGVAKDATQADIKKAYKKLTKEWHPDKHPDEAKKAEAIEKFKVINGAFETLSDERKRAAYDRSLEPRSYHNSFFDQFFDQQQRGENGSHIFMQCDITLEEVYKGCIKDISFERDEVCPSCDGTGGKVTVCSTCKGAGFEEIVGPNMIVRKPCISCRGSGTALANTCSKCGGEGYSGKEASSVKITVPPGVFTGQQMTFRGAGNPGRQGGRAGHLVVSVVVSEHPFFERDDINLICEVPVSFTQMVLGAKVDVPTLDGNIELKIPPYTQANSKFRIKGKGLPVFQGSTVGDLFLIPKIQVPTKAGKVYLETLEDLQAIEEPTEKMLEFTNKMQENHT